MRGIRPARAAAAQYGVAQSDVVRFAEGLVVDPNGTGPALAQAVEEIAVKVGGTWKVSQHAYCTVIRMTGVDCP